MSLYDAKTLAWLESLDLALYDRNEREISVLLKESVLVGGKRLRPLLTMLISEFLHISREEIVPYAISIEQVHAASLCHDDVIDNAKLRRGKKTLKEITSNKHAILAGDVLLADVIRRLCAQKNYELVDMMSEVISDLSKGEWLQEELLQKRDYTWEKILEIARCKTASLLSWASLVGPSLSELPHSSKRLFRKFGVNLGMAFQLVDDALDFSPENQKGVGTDLENGILNAVSFKLIESNDHYRKLFNDSKLTLSAISKTDLDRAIGEVRAIAGDYLNNSRHILEEMKREHHGDEKSFRDLLLLLDLLLNRSV